MQDEYSFIWDDGPARTSFADWNQQLTHAFGREVPEDRARFLYERGDSVRMACQAIRDAFRKREDRRRTQE